MLASPTARSVPAPLPSPPPPIALPRRLLIVGALAAYFILGYHGVAALTRGAHAHSLRTPLDDAIPFVPWTALIYHWVYTAALYPLFVVRSDALFRRVVRANLAVLTVSFAVFLLYPVSATDLRAPIAVLDDRRFTDWAVRLLYAADPPVNLFPSLHLSVAAISALSAWEAAPILGACAVPVVAGIAVSICTTKQHFVADGVAGLLLASAVYLLVLRPGGPADPSANRRDWGAKGALLYLAFHGLFYGVFFVAFLLGWRPF